MERDDAFIVALDTIKNVRDQMVDELESLDIQDWIDMLEESIDYLKEYDNRRSTLEKQVLEESRRSTKPHNQLPPKFKGWVK